MLTLPLFFISVCLIEVGKHHDPDFRFDGPDSCSHKQFAVYKENIPTFLEEHVNCYQTYMKYYDPDCDYITPLPTAIPTLTNTVTNTNTTTNTTIPTPTPTPTPKRRLSRPRPKPGRPWGMKFPINNFPFYYNG